MEQNLELNDFVIAIYPTVADYAYAVTLSYLEILDPEIFSEFERVSFYLKRCKAEIKNWDDVCGPGLNLLVKWYDDLLNWTQSGSMRINSLVKCFDLNKKKKNLFFRLSFLRSVQCLKNRVVLHTEHTH